MFGFYFLYLYIKLDPLEKTLYDRWNKFLLASYGIILFAFFATFSRVIAFVWFISFCVRAIIIRARRHHRLAFGTKEGRRKITAILIVSGIVIALFSTLYFNEILNRLSIDKNDQAVELRTYYNDQVLKSDFNTLGVGIGNFVGWLKQKESFLLQYEYQPVHNMYLLMYTETGILGLLSFLAFLGLRIKEFILKTKLKKSYHLSFFIFFYSFLFIGFFDHFLWTLQQGRFIFWSGLGVLTYLSNNDIIKKLGGRSEDT